MKYCHHHANLIAGWTHCHSFLDAETISLHRWIRIHHRSCCTPAFCIYSSKKTEFGTAFLPILFQQIQSERAWQPFFSLLFRPLRLYSPIPDCLNCCQHLLRSSHAGRVFPRLNMRFFPYLFRRDCNCNRISKNLFLSRTA